MKKISEHISYKEAITSATALRRGLDNTPGPEQLKCMQEIGRTSYLNLLREWVRRSYKNN